MRNFQQLRAPITGILVDDSACEVNDLASCGGVQVTVPADEAWDDFVARAVVSGWVGLEALTALPGTVRDVVATNGAAYGRAVADTVISVRTWDRSRDAQKTFPLADCGFGTGASRFLETLPDGSEHFDILDVTFLFRQGDLTTPIQDQTLSGALGIDVGGRAKLGEVRDAVLRQRSR